MANEIVFSTRRTGEVSAVDAAGRKSDYCVSSFEK